MHDHPRLEYKFRDLVHMVYCYVHSDSNHNWYSVSIQYTLVAWKIIFPVGQKPTLVLFKCVQQMGKEQGHMILWQCAQKPTSTSHPGSAVLGGCPIGSSLELDLAGALEETAWSPGLLVNPISIRADHDKGYMGKTTRSFEWGHFLWCSYSLLWRNSVFASRCLQNGLSNQGSRGLPKVSSPHPPLVLCLKTEAKFKGRIIPQAHTASCNSCTDGGTDKLLSGSEVKNIFDVDRNIYYVMTLFHNMTSMGVQIIVLLEYFSKIFCVEMSWLKLEMAV